MSLKDEEEKEKLQNGREKRKFSKQQLKHPEIFFLDCPAPFPHLISLDKFAAEWNYCEKRNGFVILTFPLSIPEITFDVSCAVCIANARLFIGSNGH